MKLLITGASGQVGGYLLREARSTDTSLAAWSGATTGNLFDYPLRPVDLTSPKAIRAAFADAVPDVVVHLAALARMGECYRDPKRARAINVEATQTLAELCEDAKARLLYVSTDLVFDGESAPYDEDASPRPVSVYGHTKLDAEAAVLEHANGLVVRTSLLFGPTCCGRPVFFDHQITALREGKPITLFSDEWRTPLDMQTLAEVLLELAERDDVGLLHVGGPERMSRVEMGQRLAKHLGVSAEPIRAVPRESVPGDEPRPRDVSLDSTRVRSLLPSRHWPTFDEALSKSKTD